jgi:hypothetical protein
MFIGHCWLDKGMQEKFLTGAMWRWRQKELGENAGRSPALSLRERTAHPQIEKG